MPRATHAACPMSDMERQGFAVTPTSRTRVMLNGLTRNGAAERVPLARSWRARLGDTRVALDVDGRAVPVGPTFRQGHRDRLEGRDRVVWRQRSGNTPLRLRLVAAGAA